MCLLCRVASSCDAVSHHFLHLFCTAMRVRRISTGQLLLLKYLAMTLLTWKSRKKPSISRETSSHEYTKLLTTVDEGVFQQYVNAISQSNGFSGIRTCRCGDSHEKLSNIAAYFGRSFFRRLWKRLFVS